MYFDILNRLGVAHKCVRQRDRRTDGLSLAIARCNTVRPYNNLKKYEHQKVRKCVIALTNETNIYNTRYIPDELK